MENNFRVTISGNNIDLGENFRQYAEEEIKYIVGKYFDRAVNANIKIAKDSIMFVVSVTVNEGTGKVGNIKVVGKNKGVYEAFGMAKAKLAKILRKYKSQIKNHHNKEGSHNMYGELVTGGKEYIFADEDDFSEGVDKPLIIAEKQLDVVVCTVASAVMKLELEGLSALMFVNKMDNHVCFVYKKDDGNIGWLDSEVKKDL